MNREPGIGPGGLGGPGGQPAELAWHRAEIDQATGMLTDQLGVSIADAFAGCGPMLTLTTSGWPMSPVISWPAVCGCTPAPAPAPGRSETVTRERVR